MKLSKTYELQGLIWKNTKENWCRKCPSCNNTYDSANEQFNNVIE